MNFSSKQTSFCYFRHPKIRAVLIKICKVFNLLAMLLVFLLEACDVPEPANTNYVSFVARAKWYESVDEPDSALFFYKSALALTSDNDSILKLNYNLADLNIRLEKTNAALDLLNVSDSLIARMSHVDDWFKLRKIHVTGKLYYLQRNYEAAQSLFEQVLDTVSADSFENAVLVIRILNYKGIVSLAQSQVQLALKNFQTADSLCKSWKVGGWDYADVIQNIGIIHAFQADYDSAGMYFEKSKNIREALYGVGDQRLKSFYLNYARYMYLLSNVETSLKYNQMAEALFLNQRNRNEETFGKLLLNIGNNFTVRNDFEKAMIYYRNALNAFSKVNADRTTVNISKINLAFVLNQLGKFEDAITLLNDIDKADLPNSTLAKIERNIALSYEGLGDVSSAVQHFRKYIGYTSDQQHDKAELGLAYNTLGEFLLKSKDFKEAIFLFENAETEYKKSGNTHLLELLDVYRNLATCYFSLRNYKDAESYFKSFSKGLANYEVSKMPKETAYENSMLQLRIIDYYLSFAEFHLVKYMDVNDSSNLSIAFDSYNNAFNTIESLTISLSDESWLKLNERLQPHYQNAVEVAWQLFKHTGNSAFSEAAFGFSARSKAVLLMSSLRQSEAVAAGLPPSLSEMERGLKAEIQSLGKLVAEEQQKQKVNANRLSYLENKHFQLIRRYDSLLKVVENDFPAYYNMRFNPTVKELAVVQKNLEDDEFMVEYLLGDSTYYIFGIGKNSFSFERMQAKDSLLQAAMRFRDHCATLNPNYKKSDLRNFIHEANDLYEKLIFPIDNQLKNNRLIIVPDGVLGYVPFEMLLNLKNPETVADTVDSFVSLPFLFVQTPVSYAYSSGMRLMQQLRRTAESKGFLAVAPAYHWPKVEIRDSVSVNLQPLPFATGEAEQVADFWNGETMLSDEASKHNFIKNSGTYQILHLAMHGLINDEKPQYSRLVFQPASNVKQTVLETYELYSLNLNADLVVLSACNTGGGKLRMGEGVISLSRGFLFAGVPAIVMTGWEVNDKSGSDLSAGFYKYLRAGFPKDIALQKAKLDYLTLANNFKSHPFFWASYMVVGDNKPLVFREEEKKLPVLYYFTAAATIALLAGFLCIKKCKRKSNSHQVSQ